MTSSERVYATSSGPNVVPDNLKSLCEVRESVMTVPNLYLGLVNTLILVWPLPSS